MIVFPNAKINLGLHVASRREDGYHNLETVFYPLPFYDALEVIGDSSFSFTTTGISCGNPDENLCVKAFQILKKDFPQLPEVRMHLHKTIPTGGGLGGGSADGAFTLTLLNEKYALGLDQHKLREYALQLGSDCPFFIINQPCFASGRGEILSRIALSLHGYFLLLVMPGIHISTKKLFGEIQISKPDVQIAEVIYHPIREWEQNLKNDFEPVAFKMYPELEKIKSQLYDAGAIYAAMTGTGSTVYGIFKEKISISTDLPYSSKWLQL